MTKINFIFITIILLIITGCSQSNMTAPVLEKPSGVPGLPVWVSDYDHTGNVESGAGIMGLFSVEVDAETLSGEMVSLRAGTLEDVVETVDITNFLQLAPCSDCARLMSVEMDIDGNIVVKIGIRHPFEAGDPLKPVSGRNRADLHVFNVEGIVVIDGSDVTEFPGLGVSSSGLTLLNADGLTGYLDPSLDEIYPTESEIHPFITHFADYSQGNFNASNPMGFESVVEPPPSGNLVMPMGSNYDVRDYVFSLDDTGIEFMFAVGCTYGVSAANKALRFTPEYRVPQHNKKAASQVRVVIDSNDLGGLDTSSEAQLTIEVLDINHGVAVGSGLDQMKADSSVSGILVEVPGVTSSPVNFSTTPVRGDGRDPADPLAFTGTITNSAGGAEGVYTGLVKVSDSYPAGINELVTLNGKDGITRVSPIQNPLEGLFDIPEFATYQVFQISVATGNEDPIAILNPDPANGCEGSTIWFDGYSSYDPDGTIVLYEFDFDLAGGNPANFSADVSGTESRVESPVYQVGIYTAALRVEDNLGASDIDTVQVTIDEIDGFDVSPYNKSYVTDTSFSNIIFTPNGFVPYEWNNLPRPLGMEAMATGSSYIYAIYFAIGSDGTGVYFARSGDSGETWGDYAFIHPFASSADYKGAAICAAGNEVFIAVIESEIHRYYIYYSDDSGQIFEQHLILEEAGNPPSIGLPSIAVDPVDTSNIYAAYAHYAASYYTISDRTTVLTSNSGISGTFTKSSELLSRWNGSYNDQVWTSEVKVAPDRDVYVIQNANPSFSTHRSTDYGATWNKMSDVTCYVFSRHADYCFDPNNPETIYMLLNRRWYNTIVYYRSTNGGGSWSTMNSNFQVGADTAYSNAAICTDRAGNLYAVFTDVTPGNADVYGRYSTDNGSSFGSAFQVSTHPGNDAEVEIIPTTSGCDVIIGWLEDRDGTPRVVSIRG
jgi:hypothetical protein